jgi:hypothetical protein
MATPAFRLFRQLGRGTVLLFQIRERRDVHRDGEECAYCSCLDALCALSAVYAFDDVSA